MHAPALRRGARVVGATVCAVAVAALAHLLWVDGTDALPASVAATAVVGALYGGPLGLVLAAWAEWLRYMRRVEDRARATCKPEPEPEPAQREPERVVETPPAPGPAVHAVVPSPAPASAEAQWAQRWAAALAEPDARRWDADPTVHRARAGSLLEVQAGEGGEFAVRRMRALRGPSRGRGLGDVGVWAVTPAAWALHVQTGHPVPAERVLAELVLTVEDAAEAEARERD